MRIILSILFFSWLTGFAQMTPISRTITIGSVTYTVGIVLPSSYTDSVSKKYPSIMMLNGTGEFTTNPATIYNEGPIDQVLDNGWSGTQMWNGVKYEFILYSLQSSPGGTPSSTNMIRIYDTLYTWYRHDTTRQYVTGVSAGGQSFLRTVAYSGTASVDRKMLLWNAAAIFSSGTSISGAIIDSLARYTRRGGSIHYAIGESDFGDGTNRFRAVQYYNPSEAGRSGSCIAYEWTASNWVGGTGHGPWQYGYDSTTDHPMGYNIYEWFLMHDKDPYASAESATINITSPVSSATINGITREFDLGWNGHDIEKEWTQISGTAATIVSPTSDTTEITGLTDDSVFRLTVTAAGGLSATYDVTINVTPSNPDVWRLRKKRYQSIIIKNKGE